MPTTRYLPLGGAETSLFTDLSGGTPTHLDIDDDPDAPNTVDGIKETAFATNTDTITLDVEPPVGSLASGIILARIFGHCSSGVGDVVMTGAALVDNASVIAAQYGGAPRDFGIGDFKHDLHLVYTPGSYDWSTAKLVIDFEWIDGSELFIYAIDYAVVTGDPPGPGGQRSRNASFFMAMRGP